MADCMTPSDLDWLAGKYQPTWMEMIDIRAAEYLAEIHEMAQPKIRLDILFGSVELMQEYRWEGKKLACYGWSITRDQYGNERSRTEPTILSTMTIGR